MFQTLANTVSQSDLKGISSNIQTTVNAVMGAFSGVIALALIVIAIFYFVRLSAHANDVEKRQKYLTSIKWVAISFIAVLLIWGISAVAVSLMETKLSTSTSISSIHLNMLKV